MAQTVIGFFKDKVEAQHAEDVLVSNGFARDQVDVARGVSRENTDVGNDRGDDNNNGITRFFKSLLGDSDDADRYSRAGNSGYSIVTVHAASAAEAERAADLMDDCGAVDIDEHDSRQQLGATAASGRDTYSDNPDRNDRDMTIPRIKGDLDVSKRNVDTGHVRVRSRIVERPVEENIRLREEHVRVERNPIDRAATPDEMENFKESTIELTEHKEVPVVNKEARVVEEIRISKEVDERNETIRDTVRDTEVDVDRTDSRNRSNLTGDSSVTGNRNDPYTDYDDNDRNRRDYYNTNRRDGDPLFGA